MIPCVQNSRKELANQQDGKQVRGLGAGGGAGGDENRRGDGKVLDLKGGHKGVYK